MVQLHATLKEKQELAEKALNAAVTLRNEHLGKQEWAEHEPAFDKHMADFRAANAEVEKLRKQISASDELDRELNARRELSTQIPPRAPGAPESHSKEREEKYCKAFARYIRQPAHCQSFEGMSSEDRSVLLERWAHVSSQADLGGALAPEDFRNQVIADEAGYAVIRPLADVQPTASDMLVFPSITSNTGSYADVYTSGYAGAWRQQGYVTGGTAPTVQNQPRFGQERIPVNDWIPDAVEVTPNLLEDSAANLESILARIIAETKAADEDYAFINGTGVGQPQGIMPTIQAVSANIINTGDADDITYNGLIDLIYSLPAQYRRNANLLMNSLTYGEVLKMADSQARPLFQPGMTFDQVNNVKIVIGEFMPDVGSGTYPILVGNFKYYVVAERGPLRIQRLAERYAPNVGFLPMARTGGKVVRTAAFRVQKCAV